MLREEIEQVKEIARQIAREEIAAAKLKEKVGTPEPFAPKVAAKT
jgi:hypothetical protein